jgi:hypothetical protein
MAVKAAESVIFQMIIAVLVNRQLVAPLFPLLLQLSNSI